MDRSCYRTSEDDEKFELSVNLRAGRPTKLVVQVEQDGHVIRVAGKIEVKRGAASRETQFENSITTLGVVEVRRVKAKLEDGVLTVTAPKLPSKEGKWLDVPVIRDRKAVDFEKEKR